MLNSCKRNKPTKNLPSSYVARAPVWHFQIEMGGGVGSKMKEGPEDALRGKIGSMSLSPLKTPVLFCTGQQAHVPHIVVHNKTRKDLGQPLHCNQSYFSIKVCFSAPSLCCLYFPLLVRVSSPWEPSSHSSFHHLKLILYSGRDRQDESHIKKLHMSQALLQIFCGSEALHAQQDLISWI